MKYLNNIISDMYFIKTHGNDRNPLFSNKPISDGNFENKVIDKMLQNQGLKVSHEKIDKNRIKHTVERPTANPATQTLYIPPKTHFRDETSYYQTLLHEASHCIGLEQAQNSSKDVRLTFEAYVAEHKQLPDYSTIINKLMTKEGYDNAFAAERQLGQAYLRDEIKVNVVAAATMKSMGYSLDKDHKALLRMTAEDAKTVGENAGFNIVKELITANSPLGRETRELRGKVKNELEIAVKDLGMTVKDFTKSNEKVNDREK